MVFDTSKFTKDVRTKVGKKPIQNCANDARVAYSCMYRALSGCLPDVPNLVKLLSWLNKSFDHYLKKEAPMHKQQNKTHRLNK